MSNSRRDHSRKSHGKSRVRHKMSLNGFKELSQARDFFVESARLKQTDKVKRRLLRDKPHPFLQGLAQVKAPPVEVTSRKLARNGSPHYAYVACCVDNRAKVENVERFEAMLEAFWQKQEV